MIKKSDIIILLVLWCIGWFVLGFVFANATHAAYDEDQGPIEAEISCTPTPEFTPTPTEIQPANTSIPLTVTPASTAGASGAIALPELPPKTSLRQL